MTGISLSREWPHSPAGWHQPNFPSLRRAARIGGRCGQVWPNRGGVGFQLPVREGCFLIAPLLVQIEQLQQAAGSGHSSVTKRMNIVQARSFQIQVDQQHPMAAHGQFHARIGKSQGSAHTTLVGIKSNYARSVITHHSTPLRYGQRGLLVDCVCA